MQYLANVEQYVPQEQVTLVEIQDRVQSVENILANEIVGYDEIKKLIVKIISATINKPELKLINLLLTGEKSTGKTAIFKAMIRGLGEDNCIYYDASMATRVGLLDHLISFGEKLHKYIVFDEIDKMSKQHQYGILNCVEAGIMKENKFRRHREVDVRGSIFFGSANEVKLIYPPLRSRFLTLNMPKYTNEQFNTIAQTLLQKMDIDSILIEEILQVIDQELPDKTMRDVVRLGTLVDTTEDITDLTALFHRHRLNLD